MKQLLMGLQIPERGCLLLVEMTLTAGRLATYARMVRPDRKAARLISLMSSGSRPRSRRKKAQGRQGKRPR
jgi:hypothetical protein